MRCCVAPLILDIFDIDRTYDSILNAVLVSPEYKAESAPDKHGAVYREAKTFAKVKL